MAAFPRLWEVYITLLVLVNFTSAESILFINPGVQQKDGLNFTSGDRVDITWLSAFKYTTLKVWQGPLDDGSYASEVLAANQTRDNSTFAWTATSIKNANLSLDLHFELMNGDDATCQNCTANSVNFRIREKAATSTTTNPLSSSISSIVSSTTSTPSTSAATLDSNSNAHHSPNLAVPLGVGLGVGIPVTLAVAALFAFCALRRRRKRKAAKLPRGRQPPSSAISSWAQESMQQRLSDQALMPPYQQQVYMPYRPSHTRSSGMTVSSKSSSFFEPFEFERPGSQDFDPFPDLWVGNGGGNAPRLAAIDEQDPDWPLPAHRP